MRSTMAMAATRARISACRWSSWRRWSPTRPRYGRLGVDDLGLGPIRGIRAADAGWRAGAQLIRLLHSGDLRWTINTAEMRNTWKPEESVKYIKPIVDNSPIEVVVVGDIAVDKAIAEVGRTFGALPKRPEMNEPAGMRDVKFPKGGAPVVLPHKGRADQGAIAVGWPTAGHDGQSARRAHRLGAGADAARQRDAQVPLGRRRDLLADGRWSTSRGSCRTMASSAWRSRSSRAGPTGRSPRSRVRPGISRPSPFRPAR